MRFHVLRRTSSPRPRAFAPIRRDTRVATRRANAITAVALATITAAAMFGLALGGCTRGAETEQGSQGGRSFGNPDSVAAATRVTIHEAGSSTAMTDGEGVIVVGRILEVCASAGCWFVLEELDDGISSQILVDLKPSADFTLPSSVRGRRAVVTGTLHGTPPDRVVHGVSVRLEPET